MLVVIDASDDTTAAGFALAVVADSPLAEGSRRYDEPRLMTECRTGFSSTRDGVLELASIRKPGARRKV
jgi:hypothetical protein